MKPAFLTAFLARDRLNAARDRRQAELREAPQQAQPPIRKVTRWGAMWRSCNRLNGESRHIMFRDQQPAMFRTRKEAREWIDAEYGYIGERKDLQSEPHGWRKPIPVRLEIGVSL